MRTTDNPFWVSVKKRLPAGDGAYTVRVRNKEVGAWFIRRKEIFVTMDGAEAIAATHWRMRYGMGLTLAIDQIIESLTKAKKLIENEEQDENKVMDLVFGQFQASELLSDWWKRKYGEQRLLAKRKANGR